MSSKVKKATIIASICIALIIVIVVLLLAFKPWTMFQNDEDTIITNIKAINNAEGHVYVYGEDIKETAIIDDYENAPYERIQAITDAPSASTYTYKCLVIVDVDGSIDLKTSDYEYLKTLIYDHDWWLMYIGTDSGHIEKLVENNLGRSEIDTTSGFLFMNRATGSKSGIWHESETDTYKNVNHRYLLEHLLDEFLSAIKYL